MGKSVPEGVTTSILESHDLGAHRSQEAELVPGGIKTAGGGMRSQMMEVFDDCN